MLSLKNLSCGFAAGAAGTIILLCLLYVLHNVGKGPEVTLELIYKDITWGGLWGLLLALPVLTSKWWLRGIILGVLACIVLLVFFIPGTPPVPQIIVITIVHIIWGLASAHWYKLAS